MDQCTGTITIKVTEANSRKKKGAGDFETEWTDVPGASNALEHTVTGLTNGKVYRFKVRAVNRLGSSPASPESDAVTAGADGTTTTVHLPFLTIYEGYS